MKDLEFQSQAAFEASVLQAMFAGLADLRVRYAVLRNYESLPVSVGARDIDMVVHPRDLIDACKVITGIARRMGLRYGNHFADERLTQFALVGRDATGGLLQIKIDFFIRGEVYGIEFLSAEDMLEGAHLHNGIPVVAAPVLLLDKWLFHLMVGKPLHTKYDTEFAVIARTNGPMLQSHLARFLPDDRAAGLVSVMAVGKGSTLTLTKPERRRALSRLWRAQGAVAPLRSFGFVWFRLRDRLRPHGVFLSVSGPDGSGKTTVIDMVIAELGMIYGHSAVHYAHFRPTVLPRIAEVAKKAGTLDKVDENYDRPHRATPSGWVGSMARLAYYGLDYLGGYYRSILPVLKRREVMLYDRYYYDMIADSFRSRISLPMPLLRSIGRLLPLPRYAFFIHVDAEEIHRRKQELTMEQILNLNERYNDLTDRGWLVRISNDGEPESAARAIIDHIVASQNAKALRTLR